MNKLPSCCSSSVCAFPCTEHKTLHLHAIKTRHSFYKAKLMQFHQYTTKDVKSIVFTLHDLCALEKLTLLI